MDQPFDQSQISSEIIARIIKEGCPECGLKGGTHTPECYYFGAIPPEMMAAKQPVISETPKVEAAAKTEKKEEKEMTPEEEKKFREELISRAKHFEEFAAPAPVVEVAPARTTDAVQSGGKPEEQNKEEPGAFEELFGKE